MLTHVQSTRPAPTVWQLRTRQMLRPEWLGQTVASVCWIASVFVYGISSGGDWLQLMAASAWLLSNLSVLFSIRAEVAEDHHTLDQMHASLTAENDSNALSPVAQQGNAR